MRSATRGGPAALTTSASLGAATENDGATLTNDQGAEATSVAIRGCSWRSRAAIVESLAVFTVQHVRRAWFWEAGGQQHRLAACALRACARIVGQDSTAAATEVAATAPATRMARSRR